MAEDNVTPIEQVPKDFDELATGVITSPLHKPFKWTFDGQEVVVPGMKKVKQGNKMIWRKNPSKPVPLKAAMLLAHHIAQKIVRKEHRDKIEAEKDEKKREKLEAEAIPNYKKKCWEIQKEIVKNQEAPTVEGDLSQEA